MEETVVNYLRNVLRGQQNGKILNLELATVVKNFLDNDNFVMEAVASHSSNVFLLSSKLKNEQKFILKIRTTNQEKKHFGLKTEADICLELANDLSVTVPKIVLYGSTDEFEIALYGYRAGVLASDVLLDDTQIIFIWSAILEIQNRLIISKINSVQSIVKNLNEDHDFSGKIVRHTSKLLNIKLDPLRLKIIDDKLNLEKMKRSRTILSDRSPANWIISGNDIIAIDFDLLLPESCLGDFVLFIDDYRLSVPYNRNTMIGNCLNFLKKKGISFTHEDFHWCAVNRNLLQGALLYKNSKAGSLFCYQRALDSSIILKAGFIEQEIRKILPEVA